MRRRDPRDEMEDLRADAPAGLFLSRRGNWFHDGQRVGHERLEALLHGHIARADDGRLIVTTGRDVVEFVAEDAPFFVVAVDGDTAVLSDGSREVVGDVVVGEHDHRWHMRVKGGRFWALFTKSAAQTLEPLIDPEGRTLLLPRVAQVTTTSKKAWSD